MGRKKRDIDRMLKGWRLTHLVKRGARFAPVRMAVAPVVSPAGLKASYIPVREDVEVPPGAVMPRALLEDLVGRASHRFIASQCLCRAGEGCERYPREVGCLLLGEGTLEIDPSVGRHVDVGEALAHVEGALALGLIPLIGHLKTDALTFRIRRFDRFLTVCFCCPCCCVWLSEMRHVIAAYPDTIQPLEGVSLEVSEECAGCGQCVPVCPVENITLDGGCAVMGASCIGCGVCVDGCTRGHISIRIEPGARMMEDLRRRVEAGVVID